MGLAARVRALVAHRRILWLLVRRDLKVRYASSALGYLWTVLDPFMMILIYCFVFSVIFRGRDVGEEPYILYLAFGQLAWQWFNGTVTDATRALTSETRLVRSTRLPREIWVLKVVLSKGLEYLFSLPVIGIFMVANSTGLTWQTVYFPIGLALQTVLLTGLGLLVASVTVLVRDLARVVRIVLRMAFYATPILYSVNSIEQPVIRKLYALNPLTGILDLYRASVFPREMASWGHIGLAAVISLLVLAFGARVFAHLESPVLKEL
jgi:ABC-2 type transport system permease protein